MKSLSCPLDVSSIIRVLKVISYIFLFVYIFIICAMFWRMEWIFVENVRCWRGMMKYNAAYISQLQLYNS